MRVCDLKKLVFSNNVDKQKECEETNKNSAQHTNEASKICDIADNNQNSFCQNPNGTSSNDEEEYFQDAETNPAKQINTASNNVTNNDLHSIEHSEGDPFNQTLKIIPQTSNVTEPDSLNASMIDSLELNKDGLSHKLTDSIEVLKQEPEEYESLGYMTTDSIENISKLGKIENTRFTSDNGITTVVDSDKNYDKRKTDTRTVSKENVPVQNKPVSLSDILFDSPSSRSSVQPTISAEPTSLNKKPDCTSSSEVKVNNNTNNVISLTDNSSTQSKTALKELIRNVNQMFAIDHNLVTKSKQEKEELVSEKKDMSSIEQIIGSEKQESDNQKRKCEEIEANVKKLKSEEALEDALASKREAVNANQEAKSDTNLNLKESNESNSEIKNEEILINKEVIDLEIKATENQKYDNSILKKDATDRTQDCFRKSDEYNRSDKQFNESEKKPDKSCESRNLQNVTPPTSMEQKQNEITVNKIGDYVEGKGIKSLEKLIDPEPNSDIEKKDIKNSELKEKTKQSTDFRNNQPDPPVKYLENNVVKGQNTLYSDIIQDTKETHEAVNKNVSNNSLTNVETEYKVLQVKSRENNESELRLEQNHNNAVDVQYSQYNDSKPTLEEIQGDASKEVSTKENVKSESQILQEKTIENNYSKQQNLMPSTSMEQKQLEIAVNTLEDSVEIKSLKSLEKLIEPEKPLEMNHKSNSEELLANNMTNKDSPNISGIKPNETENLTPTKKDINQNQSEVGLRQSTKHSPDSINIEPELPVEYQENNVAKGQNTPYKRNTEETQEETVSSNSLTNVDKKNKSKILQVKTGENNESELRVEQNSQFNDSKPRLHDTQGDASKPVPAKDNVKNEFQELQEKTHENNSENNSSKHRKDQQINNIVQEQTKLTLEEIRVNLSKEIPNDLRRKIEDKSQELQEKTLENNSENNSSKHREDQQINNIVQEQTKLTLEETYVNLSKEIPNDLRRKIEDKNEQTTPQVELQKSNVVEEQNKLLSKETHEHLNKVDETYKSIKNNQTKRPIKQQNDVDEGQNKLILEKNHEDLCEEMISDLQTKVDKPEVLEVTSIENSDLKVEKTDKPKCQKNQEGLVPNTKINNFEEIDNVPKVSTTVDTTPTDIKEYIINKSDTNQNTCSKEEQEQITEKIEIAREQVENKCTSNKAENHKPSRNNNVIIDQQSSKTINENDAAEVSKILNLKPSVMEKELTDLVSNGTENKINNTPEYSEKASKEYLQLDSKLGTEDVLKHLSANNTVVDINNESTVKTIETDQLVTQTANSVIKEGQIMENIIQDRNAEAVINKLEDEVNTLENLDTNLLEQHQQESTTKENVNQCKENLESEIKGGTKTFEPLVINNGKTMVEKAREQQCNISYIRQDTKEFEYLEKQYAELDKNTNELKTEDILGELISKCSKKGSEADNTKIYYRQDTREFEILEKEFAESTSVINSPIIKGVGEEKEFCRQDTKEFENLERQCEANIQNNTLIDDILGELVSQSTSTSGVEGDISINSSNETEGKINMEQAAGNVKSVSDNDIILQIDNNNSQCVKIGNKLDGQDKNTGKDIQFCRQDTEEFKNVEKQCKTTIQKNILSNDILGEIPNKLDDHNESKKNLDKEGIIKQSLESNSNKTENEILFDDQQLSISETAKINLQGKIEKGQECIDKSLINADKQEDNNNKPLNAPGGSVNKNKTMNRVEIRPSIRNKQINTKLVSSNNAEVEESNQQLDNVDDELKNKVELLQQELDSIKKRNRRKDHSAATSITEKEDDKGVIFKYRKIIEDYEKHIAKQTEDLKKLKNQSDINVRHFTNTEMAFSDVFEKYEKAKFVITVYRKNEDTLLENIQNAEEQLSKLEAKCQAMKEQSLEQIRRGNEQIVKEKTHYKQEITKLQAQVKRLEIKASSLKLALKQKTDECQELAAFCDDITGRNST